MNWEIVALVFGGIALMVGLGWLGMRLEEAITEEIPFALLGLALAIALILGFAFRSSS